MVAFVARIDGYGGVSEHGFGTRGSYGEKSVRARDRILDVPEVAWHFLVNTFEVGDGRVAGWAPVDHVFAAIDEAPFVEGDEDFADGAG